MVRVFACQTSLVLSASIHRWTASCRWPWRDKQTTSHHSTN